MPIVMVLNISDGHIMDLVRLKHEAGDENSTYTSFRGIYHHIIGNHSLMYTSFLRNKKLVFSKINMTDKVI